MFAKVVAVIASILMAAGCIWWLITDTGLVVLAAGVLLGLAAVVQKAGERQSPRQR